MSKTTGRLYTFSEAARQLGVRRETISDLARTLDLKPTRHPANGRAMALDEAAMQALRRLLYTPHATAS